MNWEIFKHHPQLDTVTLRVLKTKKELKKLPFKLVSKRFLWKAMYGFFFNPIRYYQIKPKQNEVGYDENFRYCLKK